ncbi:MAG TPA: hypothetical protein VNR90_06475 [Vicinamibacterales bacterium]|nr:hypothetical protein [Vicinamibacterales bacterium]
MPLALLAVSCRDRAPSAPVAVIDFIKEADRADRRPPAYAVVNSVAGGDALPAIVGPAPGRLTWTLPLPRGGRFEARVAASGAPVAVRIGVSDARVYEQLAAASVRPGGAWTDVAADLSAYAGWKLSLFYRPERRLWRLILSADGGPGTVAWGMPRIMASRSSALEYAARRARLTRSEAP